jgi:uncharacterized membrane protein
MGSLILKTYINPSYVDIEIIRLMKRNIIKYLEYINMRYIFVPKLINNNNKIVKMKTAKKLTAAEKQHKTNVEIVTRLLHRKLQGFREQYLNKYVAWERERLIAKKNTLIETDGKPYDTKRPLRGVRNNQDAIGRIETKLTRQSILALEVMKEADSNFNTKIDKVAEKVVKGGLSYLGLRLEMINDIGMDLEFLIHDDNSEVHARVIFANGEIKAPHFRFITTKRKRK